MRHAPASFQCEWIDWSSHVAATVCKSLRLLCSSPAAAPCTWPLLRSDRSSAPQGLSAPPKPGLLPRPWSSRPALGPAPTALLPRCSLPGGERCPRGGGVGWAHRPRRPRSSAADWEGAWFTKSGRDLEAPRCLRRTPVAQGQLGGTAARQPWHLPAPSAGSAPWGVMCSGPAERKTQVEGPLGGGCGP